MGFLKNLLKPKSFVRGFLDPVGGSIAAARNNGNAAANPFKSGNGAHGAAAADIPAPGIQGGLGMPQLNQPQVMYPQLQQSDLPYFQPNPQGFGQGQGGMPFIRNQAMMNTLSPLMQPNYGMPTVNPYGPQNGPPQAPPGGPNRQFPIMSGGPQMPGFGQWGLQPVRGGFG